MARRAEGWKLHTDRRTGTIYVRFRHAQERYNLSTGTSDPRKAGVEAARVYSEVVSGRTKKAIRARVDEHEVQVVAAEWLTGNHGYTVATVNSYSRTVLSVFPRFFTLTRQITDDGVQAFIKKRLTEVAGASMRRELAVVMSFAAYCVEGGYLGEMPVVEKPKGEGVRVADRALVELTPNEVEAILAALPEVTRGGHHARAYYRVLYETGLRKSALFNIIAPDDYHPGRTTLRIRRENDKAKFARELPISDACRETLDAVCPASGPIFPECDFRSALRAAGVAAGLSDQRARHLSNHDFRHGRTTHLLSEPGASLLGVAYLVGHRNVTTTNRYAKPNMRAATELLRSIGSHTGRHERPQAESATKQG